MLLPRRVDIRKQARLLDDFFKIDEVVVAHQRQDGTMSRDERLLVFERGDSVAVLVFNPDAKSVVVVEQFKLPVMIGRQRADPTADGWIIEAIAGTIEPNETPQAAAIRETAEETGYKIHAPNLIGKFFSSPGGT
jgi:nudix-type nucleoside diphosphatase (YffH/AdpP family)